MSDPERKFDIGDFVFSPWAGNSFVVDHRFGGGGGAYSLLLSPWSQRDTKYVSDAFYRVRKAQREPTSTEVAHFMAHMLVPE